MHYCRLNCFAAVLVCLMIGTAQGQSLGRWRLPSTPAQFFGYGYGPGHHAPMIRMPRCTPMSVSRIEVVHSQGCQGHCGYGYTDQHVAPAPLPYYGGGRVVPPGQSSRYGTSQSRFSLPTKPGVPQPPQTNRVNMPGEFMARDTTFASPQNLSRMR